MGKTIAAHVRFNFLYISLLFSAKQGHEVTKFCAVHGTWIIPANVFAYPFGTVHFHCIFNLNRSKQILNRSKHSHVKYKLICYQASFLASSSSLFKLPAYSRVLMKCNLLNRIDAGSTFANTLELSRLYVAPIFDLLNVTWIQGLPEALVSVPQTCFFEKCECHTFIFVILSSQDHIQFKFYLIMQIFYSIDPAIFQGKFVEEFLSAHFQVSEYCCEFLY